jgi:hypothetical protein
MLSSPSCLFHVTYLRTSTNILPLTAVIVVPTVSYCSLVQSCATLGSTERSHHRATQLVITLVVTLSSRSTSPHFDKHSCSLDSRVSFLKMVFPHLSCGCSTGVFLVSFVLRTLSALHTLPGSFNSQHDMQTHRKIFSTPLDSLTPDVASIGSHHLTL